MFVNVGVKLLDTAIIIMVQICRQIICKCHFYYRPICNKSLSCILQSKINNMDGFDKSVPCILEQAREITIENNKNCKIHM